MQTRILNNIRLQVNDAVKLVGYLCKNHTVCTSGFIVIYNNLDQHFDIETYCEL